MLLYSAMFFGVFLEDISKFNGRKSFVMKVSALFFEVNFICSSQLHALIQLSKLNNVPGIAKLTKCYVEAN